jgi:hypothetical protein
MEASDLEAWRRLSAGQWESANTSVEFSSLDFLKKILPDMAARKFHLPAISAFKPEPTRPAQPTLSSSNATKEQEKALQKLLDEAERYQKMPDEEVAALKNRISESKREINELENLMREMCGGRICKSLADGRLIYRTDTLKSPLWYFENGRLAPRELWPK